MTLHLAHTASGHSTVETLREHQSATSVPVGGGHAVPLYMRNRRRRAAEFTSQSALYWVIAGAFACRQRILGFDDGVDRDGRPFTTMLLDPVLIALEPRPRRNFGGWRYLDATEVPSDLKEGRSDAGDMPVHLQQELRNLGLI